MSISLKNIVIKNYRAIKELSIDFGEGINLLVGDNGMGKTSVLEAIKIGLGSYMLGVVGQSTPGIKREDIRIDGQVGNGIIYCGPVEISGSISFNDKTFEFVRTRKNEDSKSKTMSTVKGLSQAVTDYMNSTTEIFPVLYYRSDEVRKSEKKSGKKYIDRRTGYWNCLEGVCYADEIEEWCLSKEMEAFQKDTVLNDYESFKAFCGTFLKEISGLKSKPQISYSRIKKCMVYNDKNQEYPIEYLSAGYRTALWTMMDIACRIAILNPQLKDYSQAMGIIIIDEPETHLHAKWQWNIISVFQKMLPKVQFIIATHSPIIVSSCKNASIINVENSQTIEYLEEAYAFSIGDVLEFRMGSKGIPIELSRLFSRFEAAINEKDIKTADALYKQMQEKYGDDNTEVKRAALELMFAEDD